MALTNGAAFVVVPRDPNPAVAGDGVPYRWNGSAWSGPELFASGAANRFPAAAYDRTGSGHVVWLRGENLVHATLEVPQSQLVRAHSTSAGFAGLELTASPYGPTLRR